MGSLLVEQRDYIFWRVDAEGWVDQRFGKRLGVVENDGRQRVKLLVVGDTDDEGVAVGKSGHE